MGTVILDFDSTLIPCESLELALARAPSVGPAEMRQIEAITRRGMEGELDFRASLEARLAIARPTRAELTALGDELARGLTHGAAALVADLLAAGHQVWIVSGAFRETLLPVGRALRLPDERVQGVRALWDPDGGYLGLDTTCGFCRSKVEGVQQIGAAWARPSVGVGDGATDLALHRAGLVTHFVAFVEHAKRATLVNAGVPLAANMAELRSHLDELIT